MGRYIERLIWHWNQMSLPFDEVLAFVPRAVDETALGHGVVRVQPLKPMALPGLLWENGPLHLAASRCDLFFGASYSLPLWCPVPSVVSNLGIYDSQPGTFPRWHDWRYTKVYRRSAHRALSVIANSTSTKSDLVAYYGVSESKVRVVRPGIDEVFGPIDDARALATRVRALTGRDAPYFLLVGKLSKRRHIPELLAAVAQLRDRGLPHQLVIVGANHLGIPLEEHIASAGVQDRVVYREHLPQEDLRYLYAGATAFVLPTSHEGFSFTILEALACGAPVITVDHAPLHEGVYESVLALRAPEPTLLADAMARVSAEPALASSLRMAGLATAKRFSWRRVAEETMDVLAEAAGL